MKSKGMRMALWILGGLALVGVAGGVALQVAIARNGPAVLDNVDRLSGGTRAAERVAVISTGPNEQQKLAVWGPAGRDPAAAPLPVLLFVHGGSWRSGDPLDYGFIARAFVPEGFIVVLAGYRLGEDGRYPAMLEDTASAIAWTHEEIASYGGDPQRIVIAGHSAGAYNVAMVALEGQWLGRRGMATSDIAGVIGLSGPYDFVPFDSESTIAAFGHADDPDATQPINHLRADAPQMLLIHGEEDTLVKPRNTRVLAEQLEATDGHALSVIIPGMEHNDPLIALAAPWRSRRDVAELMAGFAIAVSDPATRDAQTSVPVQAGTR